MNVTISTHNGTSIAVDHNKRNPNVVSKEPHIDPQGHFEVWHHENVRDAYIRIFGDALETYNAKQTRDDRKIKSYYNAVENDAKKHTAYEMIIGVYGKDENGTPICSEKDSYSILKEFVDGWKERNPNLELIGAYFHADEPEAGLHCHIDYVPVAHGYSRGLETQNGLVKALGEMGFEKKGKITAQIQWEARENKFLEQLCNERGYEVDHPQKGQGKHLKTELYKLEKRLESTIDHIVELDAHIEQKEALHDSLSDEISRLSGERNELQDLKAKITGKDLLGRTKDYVKLPYEEYAKLDNRARQIDDIRKEWKEISADREEVRAMYKEAREVQADAKRLQKACIEEFEKQRKITEKLESLSKNKESLILAKAKEIAQDFIEKAFGNLGNTIIKRMTAFMKDIRFQDGQTAYEKFEAKENFLEKRARNLFENSDFDARAKEKSAELDRSDDWERE